MIQKLFYSNLVKGSKALGIDLYIKSDGSYDISGVILVRRKNKISIENKFSGLKQISEIKNKSVKGLPVCLSISGKGILHKRVEKNNTQNLIHQVLLNVNESDFYIQDLESNDNFRNIAVIRNETLNLIHNLLNEIDVFNIKVYLSCFALDNLIDIIGLNRFSTNHYSLTSEQNKIASIEKNEDSEEVIYNIGDDQIKGEELQAYASALGFFIDFSSDSLFLQLNKMKSEFLFKQLYSLLGWFALSFFFILLMLNYLIYNKYDDEFVGFKFIESQNIEMIKKLENLKNDFKIKEQYFINSGFFNVSEYSYYADRIANSIPKEINLTSLNINPLDEKFKNEKPLNFIIGNVQLTGNVTQSIILNNWVKKLKNFDWINQVTIVDYIQVSSESPAIFELEIYTK